MNLSNLTNQKLFLSKFLNETNKLKLTKSPIKQLSNSFNNYLTCRKLENKHEDFSEYLFKEQAQLIYEEVREAIIKRKYPIMIRSIYDYKDKIGNDQEEIKKLLSYMNNPTSKWSLFQIRFSEDNSYIFAALKFQSNGKKFASFVRDVNETKSFYSWKLIIPEENFI